MKEKAVYFVYSETKGQYHAVVFANFPIDLFPLVKEAFPFAKVWKGKGHIELWWKSGHLRNNKQA